MAARRINRDEWARQVERLIVSETAGNKTKFAARVGVTYKTVNRWLNSEVDVSQENVRAVARALELPPGDLLVRVGYYTEGDFAAPAPVPPPPGGGPDDVLDLIMTSDLPPSMKRRMIERLSRLRVAQREREAEEVQWWIDQAREA